MRVLWISIQTRKGGGDTFIDNLKKALEIRGIEIEVKKFNRYHEFFPYLIKLKDLSNSDIVISNLEFGWLFKRKENKIILISHHNIFDEKYSKYKSFFQKIYHKIIVLPNMKRSVKVANKVIAVSNYTKKSIQENFGDRPITVIYNGIDTKKFRPINVKSSDKRFKLLFVGNLIRRKGADLLPKIMEKLGSNFVLYYTSGLRRKIPSGFNLPNMIPFGKLSEKDLIREYNKCDALLFPTRLEGFGYAVAEAMACGKPVIATNCSSIPELVEDGKNGFLCEMDDVDEFVRKVKTLSLKNSLIKKMRKFNRRKVIEKFSLLQMGKSYKKIILT